MEKVFDNILSYEVSSGEKKYMVSPKTVADFFTTTQQLKIPDYQRPYSWEVKNIRDLLEDVLKLSFKADSSWFLGPIFTVRRPSEAQFSQLLDGQQRITTIQIILREASQIRLEVLNQGIDLPSISHLHRSFKLLVDTCERCLIRLENMKHFPIFETEPSMRAIFTDYIVNFQEIEDYATLIQRRHAFEHDTKKAYLEGSATAGTVLTAINEVRKFLRENFLISNTTVEERLEGFINFINALTTRCWLIEIPLQNHEDSVQIFESLNNRGKKLTLVDKLRFKSILKCSKDSIDIVRSKWKEVYAALNFMTRNAYVKSEDDFYKVFFNSIKGDKFTKEEDFIQLFTDKYLTGDDSIKQFLEETLIVVEFYKVMTTALDDKNSFVDYFQAKDREKVKAILQVLKQTLIISDNSRFILFYIIRTYNEFHQSFYSIIQAVWNLIRLVFYEEIYRNKKSNEIRTEYLDRIEEYYQGTANVIKASGLQDLSFNKSITNLILTTNANEAKFVLYLYAYLTDYEELSSYSPNQYKYSHLDHMCPQKWVENWSYFEYTKKDAIEFLSTIEHHSTNTFSKINFQHLKNEIEQLDSFSLDHKKGHLYSESLIEFIGNKWVLHAGTNITNSNHDFDKKKEKYQEQKWIKIPSNSNEVGINNYDKFTYEEVLSRSLKICDTIFLKFYNTWDSI